MNKAIFLDRDGTINFDYDHVFHPERITLLPGVSESIAVLREMQFKIIIVTNQSCVGRGYTTLEQVHKTNDRLKALLCNENPRAIIDDIEIAAEHPSELVNRRKPSSRMIDDSVEKLKLTPRECWIIGDRESDCLSGVNAGLPEKQCLLVKKNQTEPFLNSPFQSFVSLTEASAFILKNLI